MLKNLDNKTRLISHRGLRKNQFKPNSLEGVHYQENSHLECDIFMLSDSQLAVVHNKDHDITMKEIESWDIEICKKKNIPLLKDFILANLEQKNYVMIEVKASSPEQAKKTVKAIILLIHQLRQEGHFKDFTEYPNKCLTLHSFSIDAIKYASEIMEQTGEYLNLKIGWPSFAKDALDMSISKTMHDYVNWDKSWSNDQWNKAGIKLARQLNCQVIYLFINIITKELIDFAHSQGLKVTTGIINNPDEFDDYFSLGVDTILTEV